MSAAKVNQAKIDQQKKQEELKKEKEALKAEQDKEIQIREDKFTPFVKFCQKNGIKEKDSLWSDKRIKYVRSGDFVDFIRENLKDVKKLVEDFEWKNDGNDDDMHKFLKYLMDWRILLRFERYEDPVDKKVYKYPKRLLYNPQQIPGPVGQIDKSFYNFNIQIKSKKLGVYSSLLILGIALICLFPVWPLIVKKGIYLCSLYLLIFMIGTSILRLIIWGCFRTIGYDFWIWPNLYNDDLPFLDTFKPFYSNERCTDDWLGYILRIVGVFILAALFTWVYTEHIAIMETAEEGFNDAYEWGVNKMQNPDLPSRALPGYETFNEPENEAEKDGESAKQ